MWILIKAFNGARKLFRKTKFKQRFTIKTAVILSPFYVRLSWSNYYSFRDFFAFIFFSFLRSVSWSGFLTNFTHHWHYPLFFYFFLFFFFTQTNRNNSPKIILSLWLHLSRRNIILPINKHTDSVKSLIGNRAYNYRRLNKYLTFEWKITSPKIDPNKRYGTFKCVICWLVGNVTGTAVLY